MTASNPAESQPPHPNVILELIKYDRTSATRYDNLEISTLLSKLETDKVNWINIDGLNNQEVIDKVQDHFGLHALLIDDIVADQRPKSEEYESHLFFTMKVLHRIDGMQIDYEQIS